jgi:serine/threonine protein kinase
LNSSYDREADARVADPEVDPLDGAPLWDWSPGDHIAGGNLAWQRLGVGYRCETWLVWSTSAWAPAVLKLPTPEQIDHPRARLALSREAQWLTRCHHPALPRLLADGQDSPRPYLLIEYIDGPRLDETIEEDGPLPAAEAVLLVSQLAGVVRHLHQQGAVHVDIKPANVLLRDGRAVLIDLGSARPIGRPQPAGASPIGSPGYAAPELENGHPIAPSMDIYGLGAVLYEIVSGARAFDRELGAADRPIADTDALPVDARLRSLVRSLLSPEPGDRPRDTSELLAELGRCVDPADVAPWPEWATPHLTSLHSFAEPG